MTGLCLVRLTPDPRAFVAWAARHRYLPRTGDDLGYAAHAALASALGALAPKPFYWRADDMLGSLELYGYVSATPEALVEAASLPTLGDAGSALNISSLTARRMPESWRVGQRLAFETRVRPVVRQNKDGSRTRFREVDAAAHAAAVAATLEATPTKDAVYLAWTARSFGGAAEIVSARLASMRRTRCLRRPVTSAGRSAQDVEGPDVVVRGELSVRSPESFAAVLERGLGRHRAFGFGMVLLAPSGTF